MEAKNKVPEPGTYQVPDTNIAKEIFPSDLTLPRLGMLIHGMVFDITGPATTLENSRLGIKRTAVPITSGETEGFILVYPNENLSEFFIKQP